MTKGQERYLNELAVAIAKQKPGDPNVFCTSKHSAARNIPGFHRWLAGTAVTPPPSLVDAVRAKRAATPVTPPRPATPALRQSHLRAVSPPPSLAEAIRNARAKEE